MLLTVKLGFDHPCREFLRIVTLLMITLACAIASLFALQTAPPAAGSSSQYGHSPALSRSAPRSNVPTAATSDVTLAAAARRGHVVATEPVQSLAVISVPTRRIILGVSVVQGFWNTGEIASFSKSVGLSPQIVMNYQGWAYPAASLTDFPAKQMTSMVAAGYQPEITWEPWNGSDGVNQSDFSLESIIDGSHDAYIRTWAEAAKAWGGRFLLRFAEEMNGNWRPWGVGVNGNLPGQYVQAWRHVHQLFQQVGASNVTWVWSPNVVTDGSTTAQLKSLFPGPSYVDVIGIDGYTYPKAACQTGGALFGKTMDEVKLIAPGTPVMIAETGIATSCSNRSELMAQLYHWVQLQPTIEAVTWFDHAGSPDYQIDNDPSAGAAIRQALG